jgi:flavin reductase (DIM6/NTAB) family NADH-FMN oxidoreductase RutF
VIAVPALEPAPQVARVGNASGRELDKFAAFGLTPVPADPQMAARRVPKPRLAILENATLHGEPDRLLNP